MLLYFFDALIETWGGPSNQMMKYELHSTLGSLHLTRRYIIIRINNLEQVRRMKEILHIYKWRILCPLPFFSLVLPSWLQYISQEISDIRTNLPEVHCLKICAEMRERPNCKQQRKDNHNREIKHSSSKMKSSSYFLASEANIVFSPNIYWHFYGVLKNIFPLY